MKSNSWFSIPKPNPKSKLRLFCFPYAGAGATAFREWSDYVPSEVEVYIIRLPGREARVNETPFSQVAPLVTALIDAMLPFIDKPFAFFGHSMGALVAFVLARRLRQECNTLPLQLFVSARSAPQCPARETPFYTLPDSAFIKKLQDLGGMENSVLQNDELMALLMPTLRADFQINEMYEYTPEPPLSCPIHAFRGAKDDLMTYDEVAAWCEQTTDKFRLRTLPGGHFFINTGQTIFWQIFAYDLNQILHSIK